MRSEISCKPPKVTGEYGDLLPIIVGSKHYMTNVSLLPLVAVRSRHLIKVGLLTFNAVPTEKSRCHAV